ncbi:hypothetical protein FCM35_KLT15582 [Carex littledalei]|uniref:Uncharacterized protein n=1 Tax=Carex littledalei TaxID=544730 RepID=A0A833RIL1_9POAL|nr:hypothetical protein FCM35_KLT15582 [Carex littledalei]
MISNLIQSDATPCQDLVPGTTGCLIQEEMISNLVQFLQAGPCRHIIWGIIKGILEELSKFNIDNLDAFLKFSEYIGTTAIQTSGGDTSHWTTFCTTLANNIHEITVMCRPITCDSSLHEKIVKWEAELEKLKKLVQEESYIQHRVMERRVNRDRLISELYKKSAITIERNGGVGQEIKQHKNALEGMMKELMEVASKREEVSDECYRLGQSVMQSDLDRLQREINANAIYRHVCFTVKSLVDKLEKPTLLVPGFNNDLRILFGKY